MFEKLSRDERMLLLRFVCAFAWTDLEVKDAERKFVERLIERMQLDQDERKEALSYLDIGPAPDSVSPKRVPPEHRRTFIDAVRALIYTDGDVDPEEREQFERLKAAFSD